MNLLTILVIAFLMYAVTSFMTSSFSFFMGRIFRFEMKYWQYLMVPNFSSLNHFISEQSQNHMNLTITGIHLRQTFEV